MQLRLNHFTVAAVVLLAAGSTAAAQTTSAHTFHIFVRGAQVGSEEVTVVQMADGWTLRGSGKLGTPINLTTEYWEARYDQAWAPLELTVNQTDGKSRWSVHSTFNGTAAATDVTRDGQNQRRNQTIAAGSVVLPNLIFGSYEALAARLASAAVGAQLPVFVAPQNAVAATVTRVVRRRLTIGTAWRRQLAPVVFAVCPPRPPAASARAFKKPIAVGFSKSPLSPIAKDRSAAI